MYKFPKRIIPLYFRSFKKPQYLPKDITINIDNLEKIYGTVNPPLTFEVSDQTPLVGDDTINLLDIKLKTTAETSSPVNSSGYPITLESCTNKNYKITAKNGTLRINPATFDENSIEITAYNKKYDGNEHPVITGIFPDGSTVEYSTKSPNENFYLEINLSKRKNSSRCLKYKSMGKNQQR